MERKRMVSWALTAGLVALLLWEPGVRAALWSKAKAVLGSETALRAVFFLEAGVMPERTETAGMTEAPAPPETVAPTEAPTATEVPPAMTEPPTATEAPTATEPPTVPPFTAAEAEAISFRGNCTYEVDKTALLLEPLNWPREAGPKVLILHSHACESYTQCEGHTYLPSANYRTLDLENNMIAVGDALAEALAALGVEVVHDRSLNDYPSYNASYATAREKIEACLEEYSSIVMVLDLHRDALDQPVRETVERDGQTLAPLMLVVGTDQGGLNHPHWEANLSCALKLQALGNRDEPSLFKRLSFRKERFNGDMTRGSLIVEVGSTENTLPEAIASMDYLAEYVAALLAIGFGA